MAQSIFSTLLATSLVWSGLVSQAGAAMVSVQDALTMESRAARITDLQARLARDDIKAAMMRLGVDPEEAGLRVASLNDQELAQLDGQLDQLPAAGSVLALIGAVFVVLMILEFTGVIDIFKAS